MSDNPLDRIPSFDRVSIRAVVVEDGEDPESGLAEAGILDPIAVPVMFSEDPPGAAFGDGITPNITGVLEPDQPELDAFEPASATRPGSVRTSAADQPSSGPATVTLPAAYGLQPLAPVRQRGG